MRLDYVLWLYLLIFITIFLALIRNDKQIPHSLFFALVISFAFLLLAKLPNDVNFDDDNISSIFIYFAIVTLSIVSILIYSGVMAYKNLNKPTDQKLI